MTTIHADKLNAYISEHGYTRGAAARGKAILLGDDIRIVAWDGWFSYEISEPIATLAEAEELIGVRQSVSRTFADAAAFEQYLADNDGPTGYGH